MKEENKKYYIFTLNMTTLNILSIVILLFMIFITMIVNNYINIDCSYYINDGFPLLIILYIFYMILHELLHALSYRLHGANSKNISFGAYLEKGILCCLCKENISKKNILNSLMFPLFYIGIITYILGFIIKSPLLIILSIFNIVGCVGDIFMFLYIIKLKNIEYTEYDDPVSFAIYTNKDLSKDKSIGIKYIKVVDNVERNNFKKINKSRFSIISFILLIVSVVMLTLK